MEIQCPECKAYFELENGDVYETYILNVKCINCHTRWDIEITLYKVGEEDEDGLEKAI